MKTNSNLTSTVKKTGIAGILPAIALALTGITTPISADDINVHPAACAAPFLDQAFPMRWHEHFLMNPTTGVPTWLICPMTYDNDVVTFSSVSVTVTGGVMSGASTDSPLCFFTIVDRTNLAQGIFLDVIGARRTFLAPLSTTKTGTLWTASSGGSISNADIQTAIGNNNVNDWAAAVFCNMPVGHGITQIKVVD